LGYILSVVGGPEDPWHILFLFSQSDLYHTTVKEETRKLQLRMLLFRQPGKEWCVVSTPTWIYRKFVLLCDLDTDARHIFHSAIISALIGPNLQFLRVDWFSPLLHQAARAEGNRGGQRVNS
jgi:hypothetical protein